VHCQQKKGTYIFLYNTLLGRGKAPKPPHPPTRPYYGCRSLDRALPIQSDNTIYDLHTKYILTVSILFTIQTTHSPLYHLQSQGRKTLSSTSSTILWAQVPRQERQQNAGHICDLHRGQTRAQATPNNYFTVLRCIGWIGIQHLNSKIMYTLVSPQSAFLY